MRDHRQGNDLAVIWSILRDGKPFILSGKEWKLYLKNMYERKEVDDFSVKGNQIHWTFYGKDQKTTGRYSLILVGNENEKGMITTDTCDFVNVVSCSCKVKNSEDSPNVETETIELTSSLDYVAGTGGGGEGGGSYDDTAIWEALNDKVDKEKGKGLSSNDYTTADKLKLSGLKNYDDTQIKKDIEGLSKKIEGLEPGGPGISYDDTELRNAITGLEQSKADKPILISIEALGTPAHQGEDEVMYWTPEQVEAALSMTLSELYEQAQTREVQVDMMGQTLYPESALRFEDDLIEFRYPIHIPALSGFYVLNISRSPINAGDVNTAIMLGGQVEKLATKEELTKLATEVGKKQATIEDLENIRSGAGKGATAVQPSALADYATTQQLTELSAEVGKKQDTITDLATIRSGAEKGATAIQEVKTINGQSIVGSGNIEIQGGGGGGMTTPSGDPMHYMYEAVGAEWNGTGADIEKQGVYGDTITHQAGYWYLNELGDITTEEMRKIYIYANLDNSAKGVAQLMQGITTRTNIATWSGAWNNKIKDSQLFGFAEVINVILRRNDVHYTDTNSSYMFTGCGKLEKVFPTIDATSTTSFNGAFDSVPSLKEIRLKNVKAPVKFTKSTSISKASILYLIQNSAATSAIVITLHADAYARLAEDADIVAALAEKTNVSLAK